MKTFKLPKRTWISGLALAVSASTLADQGMADKDLPLSKVTGLQRMLVVGCSFTDAAIGSNGFVTELLINADANSGIQKILDHTHEYFDSVSNGRVNFHGVFAGWRYMPKPSTDYKGDGVEATADCQNIATQMLNERGDKETDYRAIVMLFNRDLGFSSANQRSSEAHPGRWVHLRYSGGPGGGWTSEALWAHELGHAFGLDHTTYPIRASNNQYNDFQNVMSGFFKSAQKRWNFDTSICNNFLDCIHSGQADEKPVHYASFQKQYLGWLDGDQVERHLGGTKQYALSAPTVDRIANSPLRRLKMVYVKPHAYEKEYITPYNMIGAYYAIEYRRSDSGDVASAERRGWDSNYEKGIRSDRVNVYLVRPKLHGADDDLGDANLEAVLIPGDYYDAPPDKPRLSVQFEAYRDSSGVTAMVNVTSPPPTSPSTSLSAVGIEGWANQDISAQISTESDVQIAATYYGVDDPGCNEQTLDCAVYANGFTITGEGEHDVAYFSTDIIGQIERAHHTTVRLDKTPPTTRASVATTGSGIQLTLAADDALSGVRETVYDVDGTAQQSYKEPITITTPGSHTVYVYSIDNAGNVEASHPIALDVVAPPFTATATARPSRITNANGRAVKIHVAVRTNTLGSTLRLTRVRHTGKGRVAGWTLNTSDVDGVVYAKRGAIYTLTYTLTDPSGRTQGLNVNVVVGN